MNYNNNKAENVKIAYIGGGSRGWAWGLMSDLVAADDISGTVYLYDIDYEAAKNNEIIGKKFKDAEGKEHKMRLKGIAAIAFQHELDHLNGVMFYDRIDEKNPFAEIPNASAYDR